MSLEKAYKNNIFLEVYIMNVKIYSKTKMQTAIEQNLLPKNLAVISFYNEPITVFSKPIDYSGVVDRFMQVTPLILTNKVLKNLVIQQVHFSKKQMQSPSLFTKRTTTALTLLANASSVSVAAPLVLPPSLNISRAEGTKFFQVKTINQTISFMKKCLMHLKNSR
jgi:hypothetical protein